MEFKWSPEVLDGLFLLRNNKEARKTHKDLFYWYDALMEKKKFSRLKPKEKMDMSYDPL